MDTSDGKRIDAYKARSDALGKANDDQHMYLVLINVVTFIFVVGGSIIVWLNPSVHGLLIVGFGVLFLRFVVRALFNTMWVYPTMAKINREFPPTAFA